MRRRSGAVNLRRSSAGWARGGRAGLNAVLRGLSAASPEFRATVRGLSAAVATGALHDWLAARAAAVVEAARRDSPAYHALLRGLPGIPSRAAPLAALPVMDKQTFRGAPLEQWLSRRLPHLMRREVATSGSSGDPFVFFRSRRLTDYAMTLRAMREFDRWALAAPPARMVSTWSEEGVQEIRHELRSIYPRRLYVTNLSPEVAVDAVRAFQPQIIDGRAQAVFRLVDALARADALPTSLRAVRFTQETLFEHQRRHIEHAAGVPVFARYGSEELTGAFAHSCRAGRYHVHPLIGCVEILDASGRSTPRGETGRIVATSFVNTAMPFIRYDTGDMAQRPATDTCPCGSPYPSFGSLEVSRRHGIRARDGRVFTDALLAQYLILDIGGVSPHVLGFQYRQLGEAHWRMEVGFHHGAACAELLRRMQARADTLFLPALTLEISSTDTLWRTEAGKRVLVKPLGVS